MKLPIIKSPVTYLEMTSNPQIEDIKINGYEFVLEENPDVDIYIDVYREIGRDYIWNYRPGQKKEEIEKIIKSSITKLFYLLKDNKIVGIAECDFTNPQDIEVVHFGLLPNEVNKGLGKNFFQKLLNTLWQYNPKRLHLSTCGMDHPKAINFYKNAGFIIYKEKEGEFIDYRFSNFYEMSDASQIPHGKL